MGIKTLPEALNIARAADMDLVEVADKASPPVCRIMNYSKYKFEEQQRAKESRRKSTNIVIKEMKYRPKIGDGDFGTKTKKVEGFLSDGHKVKVTIMFRGREMQHPELGRKILDRIAEEVIEVGKVEVMPRQDGRNMTMVLGPDKRAQQATAKRLAEEGLEAEGLEAAAGLEAEGLEAAAPEADQPEAQLEAAQPEAVEEVEEAATPEEVPAETQDH